MIGAGELNRRVTLVLEGTAQDAFGEATSGPDDVRATVWAKREAPRFIDIQRGSVTDQIAEARFVIRYRADVTPAMTIRDGATDYSIISMEEIGNREGWLIITKVAV